MIYKEYIKKFANFFKKNKDNEEKLRTMLKGKQSFTQEIEELQKWIIEYTDDIKSGNYRDEYIKQTMYETNYQNYLQITIMRYSRGDSLEEVKESFLKTIDAYYDAYHQGRPDYESFSPQHDWPWLLNTISLAILFDITGKPLEKFLEAISACKQEFKIVHYFLTYFGIHQELQESHQYERAYKNFNAMIDLSNEEILKKKLMDKYLKSWYNNDARVLIRDSHKVGTTYSGYWAFETAAFVKMRGLDDSSFRDNVYYPKDMLTNL